MPLKTALFVIDIQYDNATDATTRIPSAERITSATTRVLAAARALLDKNDPRLGLIVFVQHEDLPGTGPLRIGSKAWELVFPPRPGVDGEWLVRKTTSRLCYWLFCLF